MISNHYPMMYSHTHGWLVLVYVGIITAIVRHYFNQKHLENDKPRYLVIPAVLTVLLIIWMRPEPIEPMAPMPASTAEASVTPDAEPPATDSATTNDDAITADAAFEENVTAVATPVAASPDDAIMNIVHTHCSTCHAAQPTQQGFAAPPAGIILQTPEEMKIHKAKIITAVQTRYMPLGNLTQLSDEQRQQIVAYTSGL